jgi:hypothetical protein
LFVKNSGESTNQIQGFNSILNINSDYEYTYTAEASIKNVKTGGSLGYTSGVISGKITEELVDELEKDPEGNLFSKLKRKLDNEQRDKIKEMQLS